MGNRTTIYLEILPDIHAPSKPALPKWKKYLKKKRPFIMNFFKKYSSFKEEGWCLFTCDFLRFIFSKLVWNCCDETVPLFESGAFCSFLSVQRRYWGNRGEPGHWKSHLAQGHSKAFREVGTVCSTPPGANILVWMPCFFLRFLVMIDSQRPVCLSAFGILFII